ncbi:hypothetical protein BJV77DRAFT_971679 [Russula vinacea]|nr:hypothetical protein BJV77DRAFT_971679 [Russula vinacea]
MRSIALTSLFLALFALFSTIAYAAPAAQGAITKRQGNCSMGECRIESNSTSSPGSTNDAAPVIYDVVDNLLGLLSNTPQPTAPTTQPTGV